MTHDFWAVNDLQMGVRNCLSLHESAVLVEVSEDRIRKDVEARRVVPLRKGSGPSSRLYFAWSELLALAVIYKIDSLPAQWRKNVWDGWKHHEPVIYDPLLKPELFDIHHIIPSTLCCNRKLIVNEYVCVDVPKICSLVAPRINLYARGLSRVEENCNIMGGASVFKGTRISVLHIGEMRNDGETVSNIVSGFGLSKEDVEFAHLYYAAHPPSGRPRTIAGTGGYGKLKLDAR